MPQYRDLSKKYEISASRYRELLYFCRQYDEKKSRVNDTYFLPSSAGTGLPHGSESMSTVERKAEKAWHDKADIELIERCIKLACDNNLSIYPCLLKNVTSGIKYERLYVPMGRKQFYELRRKFFWILNCEKG